MNLDTFQRAQVAAFCYRQARHTGSVDCMKAVAWVLRNRLKAGWGDGTWLRLMNAHGQVAGNDQAMSAEFDQNDRLLQMLVRDIDDIYLGTADDDTRRICDGFAGLSGRDGLVTRGERPQPALYYQFINLPAREWFTENIIRKPQDHPQIATIGMMALYK